MKNTTNLLNGLKTFCITTLGCKVNTYESNIIQNELLSYGLIKVPFGERADLSIINTCSVTNTADAKSRNMIRRARHINPNGLVLVCGCYSQVASKTLKELGIDILLGNKYKNNIGAMLNEYFKQHQPLVKIDNLLLEQDFEDSSVDVFKDNTRAFVKIQDGCNFMCSYCIIPFTRGKQRSKNFVKLINEIINLVNNGYKEIVLTGVNTAGYLHNNHDFFDLLLTISQLPGQFRVRISSVEPFQLSDAIVNLICLNPTRFAQHWHICLQSGSNNVLKQMNRKYSTDEFETLINKIYTLNPLTSISTDYICGFPSETDEDHENSLAFVQKIKFSKLHVFPYSKRSYTPAARLKQIHDGLKTTRVKQMLALSDQLSNSFMKQFVNKEVDVLFENYENGINTGLSSEYFSVCVKNPVNLVNQNYKVLIKYIGLGQAFGEIVAKNY